MRTGLKVISRAIKHKWFKPGFPKNPINEGLIKARLEDVKEAVKPKQLSRFIGSLFTVPHPMAIYAWEKLLKHNPGNLGFWTNKPVEAEGTKKIEYECIHQMIDLYHGDHDKWCGYVTSGATEANIFSVWLGRKYLAQTGCLAKDISLLRSNLTHYSVRKAADVCGVRDEIVPLDEATWGMSELGFEEKVKQLYKQGQRGFLVCVTHGYTMTGTSDAKSKLGKVAKKLEQDLPKSHFYFWIDAALNGLIEPFINDKYQPLNGDLVKAYVVDFHKLGLVPYSGGILLFRRDLLPLVEKPIDYLTETDATLLGSRPGAAAAAIWTMIQVLGKAGFRQMIQNPFEVKEEFIRKIRSMGGVKVVTGENSLTCGLSFLDKPEGHLSDKIEQRFGLKPSQMKILFYPNLSKQILMYKCYVFPHINKTTFTKLLRGLANDR
jgi:glutamate/tyrosine decarboxylase-like PLP-dependent enzyme